VIGTEFDVGDATEEVDTVGGYIVTLIGRVPVRGELVPGPGAFEIEILDADPRRVKRVRIYRRKPAPRVAERAPSRRPPHPPPLAGEGREGGAAAPPTDRDEAASVPGTADNSPPTQMKSKP
jgi:hypothetical protein